MNRKVLIINLEFPPVGGPGVQRVLKFVRYLPEEGWSPTVICGDRSTWHKWHDSTLLNEIPPSVGVSRVRISTIGDYSTLSSAMVCSMLFPFRRVLIKEKIRQCLKQMFFNIFSYMHPEPLASWVYRATKKAIQRHKNHGFDAVLTSGPPHITHMVGFMLKRHSPVRWAADFRDPWVDNRRQADRLGISRQLDRIWERLVLENADRIICVSPGWAKLLGRKLNAGKEGRIHVVYNGYDPDDIPDDILQPRSKGFFTDTLHIHYNGTIQGATFPNLFFKALAKLQREELDIPKKLKCTFTGLPTTVASLATSLGLNEIIRDVGPLSHRDSLEMAASSDVLLLIVNNTDKAANGLITGKVYEYVAMGKNILAIIPPYGDLYAFLKDYQQCYLVSCNNLSGVVEVLKVLMKRKRNGELISSIPPKWITQYSRQAQTRRLAQILESLVLNGS